MPVTVVRSPRRPTHDGRYLFNRSRGDSGVKTATGWTLDQSQKCRIRVTANAVLEVDAPVDPTLYPSVEVPADPDMYPGVGNPSTPNRPFIKEVVSVYPAPTLDSEGRPVNWEATSTTVSNLGRLRVVIGGKDRTFFRGVPAELGNFTINEPFGDGACTITFPQITPFEDHEAIIRPYSRAKIQIVAPDGTRTTLWHGMVLDYNSSQNESDNGLTVEMIGAFYEADLMRRKPTFNDVSIDVANHINTTINQHVLLGYLNLAFMPHTLVGFERRARGYFEKIASEYIQDLLSELHEEDGDMWTISCKNRKPRLQLKDRTTVHWTVRTGQPGVFHDLHQDLEVPNVIYGEGVDGHNCHWRNTKYPLLNTDSTPIWPGTYLNVGSTGNDVLQWEEEMSLNGWGTSVDGSYSSADQAICLRFQAQAGITVDGIVGPQTWAATFEPGENQGDLEAVRISPLAYRTEAEVSLFNSKGAIIGRNPGRDVSIPRIEQFVNYGQPVPKKMGVESAERQIARDWPDKGWFGTITLRADPNEGSRLFMRAGQNIRLRNYRGENLLFHISQVDVNMADLSVNLTVDTKARDLKTLAELKIRNYEARQDPAARTQIGRRTSYDVEDRTPVWDCESGAGIIPRHGVQARLWNVLQIPAGKFGQIAAVGFNATTSPYGGAHAVEFAVAVFDRPIVANTLRAFGDPTEADFWQDETLDQLGLLIAWGGDGQMGGYYPGTQSGDDPKTGRLIDKSSWTFASTIAPWLWVAIWCEDTTYIGGRLYPGLSGTGDLPNITH